MPAPSVLASQVIFSAGAPTVTPSDEAVAIGTGLAFPSSATAGLVSGPAADDAVDEDDGHQLLGGGAGGSTDSGDRRRLKGRRDSERLLSRDDDDEA